MAYGVEKHMTEEDFTVWARQHGLASELIQQLITYAATPERMQAAIDAMEPGPPIYTLKGIRKSHEEDDIGISPAKSGFLVVGGCPNGDPIAVDIADDPGSVWYLDHETLYDTPLRSIAVRVAGSLHELIDGICDDDDFPIDYYDAKQLQDEA